MDTSPNLPDPKQPPLFEFEPLVWGTMELFPAIWGAAEGLVSDDLEARRYAFETLRQGDAARKSGLIAYLLATRLTESDIELRAGIVNLLGEVFSPDEKGRMAPAEVRYVLAARLSEMRTRQIFALLEVLEQQPNTRPAIVRLLNVCPYASNQLVEILTSRKVSLSIRQQAVRCIGWMGYLAAIPALERLKEKIESRMHGQEALPFITSRGDEDTELLGDLRVALNRLKSP